MTPDQRTMLELAQPRVTTQNAWNGAPLNHHLNNSIEIASQCEANGWLKHICSGELNQETYEITAAGCAALEDQSATFTR